MTASNIEQTKQSRDWSDFIGCQGHVAPYIDLTDVIDTSNFEYLHEEICLGLLQVDYSYTGGSHKFMNIVPQEFANDEYKDYMQIIRGFSREEFMRFIALGESSLKFDLDQYQKYTFGEEAQMPMTWEQANYLKIRYGAYFPWKLYFQFMEGDFNWTSKNTLVRDFSEEVRNIFPATCDYIRSLPFKSIGRCDLMGLESNDHGTIHRDNYQRLNNPPVMDFITICPAGNKRLFLYNAESREKVFISSKAYTFNDMNYHGVAADPFFRYSIRIDGVFTDEFKEQIRRSRG